MNVDWNAYAKFWKLRSENSDFVAYFEWVIFMTHMHDFIKFSLHLTKLVIIMIYWKFRNRWLVKMSHQGYHERTQFMRSFRVMQYDSLYESSIMKFWTNHNYALFCWMKWKFHKTMHVSHKYDSFQICYEIEILGSLFSKFCVGGCIKFQNRYSD